MTRIVLARPGNNQLGERCCVNSAVGSNTARVGFVAGKENGHYGKQTQNLK
jgi:hypothetical protein